MFGKKKGGTATAKKPYFGLTGGWLTFWVSVACSTDMTLFGYDQGVFGTFSRFDLGLIIYSLRKSSESINTSGPKLQNPAFSLFLFERNLSPVQAGEIYLVNLPLPLSAQFSFQNTQSI